MNARALLLVAATLIIAACTDSSPPAPATARQSSEPAAAVAALEPLRSERIVFSSLRPGNWDIFYFSAPGAAPRRLTNHPGLDYDAAFSPDGRWVVFTSERRGNPDLYVIDMQQDSEPRLLIDGAAMEDQAAFSPDGATIAFVSTQSGNADIYTMPFDPRSTQSIEAAVNITHHPGGDFRPDFSPDGERIAFSSDRDTPVYAHPIFTFTRQREGELYVMNADGSGQTRLTESSSWDGSPEWSTDGETIYFYSARPRVLPGPPTSSILGQEGGFRVWAIDADGGNARAITPEGMEALAPALTADGRIAFQTREGAEEWRIVSMALEGSEPRFESEPESNYWIPDYDPASGAMVSHGIGPVAVASQAVEGVLGAGALLSSDYPADIELPDRQVTLYPMRHTTGIAPHPLNNESAVTIETPEGTRLVRANFDGSNERELFSAPGIGITSGSSDRLFDIKWSSDGDWLLISQGFFAGDENAKADIWLVRGDGSERTNLTEAYDSNDGVAAFSPDGERIVFRSSRNGKFELYLMDRDGGSVRQLTDNDARDNFPVFSPEGNAIAFSSDRDSELDAFGFKTFDNYIMQLENDGTPGEVRRISTDRGQDSHPWYSPDGKWIVYTSELAGINDEEPMVQEVLFGPQMYGEIFAYRISDGLNVRLTHNKWEEGNPFWLSAASSD